MEEGFACRESGDVNSLVSCVYWWDTPPYRRNWGGGCVQLPGRICQHNHEQPTRQWIRHDLERYGMVINQEGQVEKGGKATKGKGGHSKDGGKGGKGKEKGSGKHGVRKGDTKQ